MIDPAEAEAACISRVVIHDDHRAFAQLVRQHQGPVRRFLARLCCGDWSRADDLAQETFWKAYRHIGSFRGEGRFLSWLLRIAWQLFVTQQRRSHDKVYESLSDEHLATPDHSMKIIDGHTLVHLLATLRDDERAAIILHYRLGFTHQEVCETLELPLGTIKSLIRRARHKLQQAFAATCSKETP